MQPSIYATSIADDKYLHNTRLYLAVSAEMPEADVIAKTPYLIKLCSAAHIEHLVKHALPGVPLTHVHRPPSAIPVKLNYQYFSVNQSGVAWEAVIRARNLAACAGRFSVASVRADRTAARGKLKHAQR